MRIRPRHRRMLPLLAAVALAAAGAAAGAASATTPPEDSGSVTVPAARGLIQPLPSHLVVGLAVSESLARGASGARVVDGALPPGLTLDSRALLAGTPTSSGTFSATVSLRLPATSTSKATPVTFALPLVVDDARETVRPGEIVWDGTADAYRFTPTVVDSAGEPATSAVAVTIVSGPGRIGGSLRFDRFEPGSPVVIAARGSGTTIAEVRTAASAPVRLTLRRGMGADLSVKITGPRRVAPASTAAYTFTASNAGPLSADGILAAVEIPDGTVFVGSTCGGTPIGTRLLITADGLAAGQSLGCEITIGIPPEAEPGMHGVVRVGITSLVHDPHTDNNVRSTTVRVG